MSVKLDLKNALINGDFSYFQRNTSFAAIADSTYTADRWMYRKTGTMVHTVSRSSDVPSSAFGIYSLLSDCTTAQVSIGANDYTLISQRIEGNILRSFKNKKVVLSFWVKSTKTGTFCISIRNATDTRSLIKEYTISASNTWEKKIVRFQHDSFGTWDYANGIGLKLGFVLACGSNLRASANSWQSGNFIATSNQVNACDNIVNNFWLTDACLQEDNEGQTREPEFRLAGRDIFEELQLCQRYYEVGMVASSGTAASTFSRWWSSYKTEKRIVPVVTYTIITGQNASAPSVVDVNTVFGAAGRSTGENIHDWTAWTFRADAEL
jgi:hypothetical protein